MGEDILITPNLFLVGFQKCGSSALFEVLNSHPKICGSQPKETFALVDGGFEHYNLHDNVIAPNFSWRRYYLDSHEETKYFLEGSVCNFYQERALELISENKRNKVIFLIRNPIDRFISCYNYDGKGGVHLPMGTSLEEFFGLVQNGEIDRELLRYSLEHGRYSRYMDRWVEKLGEQNVYFTSFERIKDKLPDEMESIFQFLSIKSIIPPRNLPKANVTKAIRNERLHNALRDIFGGKGLLQKIGLKNIYDNINRGVSRDKVKLSANLEKKLRDYYRDEFERFKDYF